MSTTTISPTTGKLFAAYALKAASGDAKSAVSSAASAIARAVFQLAHAGNKTPLIEAAKVAQDLSKKKTAKSVGAVSGFLAVIEVVDFIDYSEGYIFDRRVGADKAMPRDKAHEIEADCIRAFVAGFDAGVTAHKEAVATKKAKDDAAEKIANEEANTAIEEYFAENSINMADKVLLDIANVADTVGIDAIVEAIARIPTAKTVIEQIVTALSDKNKNNVAETGQDDSAVSIARKQVENTSSALARAKVELSEIKEMFDAGTTNAESVTTYEKRLKTARARHTKASKMLEELLA